MPTQNKKIALTITANTRQLRQDMRRAGAEVKGFERQVTGLGTKLRNMRMRFQRTGIMGRGGSALRTAAGFAGAFGIQQMFQGAKEENAALTDIAITGNLTDKQLQKLRKTMFEVSNATSKSTSELTSFVATVTTMTGDAAGAAEALEGIGEVMVATGASGEALAGTYVKLTTTMGLLPKQAKDAFNILRSQEKLGSVTLANIAANFGKIVGAAGVYGAEGKGLKGTRTLGGLFQIAQRGFGVGQEGEAATSAAAFLSFTGRRAKQIKKTFGVDVFNKAGQARDLPTVLEELGKAFIASPEKFRTKGQLIFGRAGIRTAQQLAEAARAPGGFSGKLGSFASAHQLLRTAGGEDIIGRDAARRRRSASYQFDEQINILKNSFKKHLIPVFKSLAATMKDVGPDLVRIVKFLLENSRGLLKLWLGYKGVTFFKNLMAPIQGGGSGALAGMAGAVGGVGGGSFMGPDGQLIRGGPATARAGSRHGAGWFAGGGRSGWRSSQNLGLSSTYIRGQWGVSPNATRSLGGGRFGSWYGRNQAAIMRGAGYGARGGGMVLGAAGMMGMGPQLGPEWANMASNMGLMSGNPYAMAAGGAYKAGQYGKQYGVTNAVHGGSGWGARRIGMMVGTLGASEAFRAIRGDPGKKFGISMGPAVDAFTKALDDASKAADSFAAGTLATSAYYSTTWRGFEEKQRQEKLMGGVGFGKMLGTSRGGILGSLTMGYGSHYGMTAEDKVSLAGKLGESGLKTLSGKLQSRKRVARAIAVGKLREKGFKGEVTEAKLAEDQGSQYSKLKEFQKIIDSLIMVFKKGYNVNVNTVSGMTPGQRVEGNSAPTPGEAGGGVLGSYILGA
jgi:hypothetical protein